MSLIGNHLLMDIYTSTQPNLKDPIMMQSIVAMIVGSGNLVLSIFVVT